VEDILVIKKDQPIEACKDLNLLKKKMVKSSQELSGKIWTDYNDHDPGITIIEQLSLALAELGYKANLPVQDLVFTSDADNDEDSFLRNEPFIDIKQLFSVSPVTSNDYRKLIIDNIKEVQNIWLELDNSNGKRMYKVSVILDDIRITQRGGNKKDILEKIQNLLMENRNLGEDFDINLNEIKPVNVTYTGRIIFENNIDKDKLIANVLFQLSNLLSPSIPYRSLSEMTEKGYRLNQIFEGPMPVNGIIDYEDLRKTQHFNELISTAKVAHVLQGIEGVKQVANITDNIKDKSSDSPNKYRKLDIDTTLESLEFYIDNEKFKIDKNVDIISKYYENQVAAYESKYKRYIDGYHKEITESPLNKKELLQYFTIQNHFPSNYGLGNFNHLNVNKHSEEQQLSIKQLKAYLLIFEFFMQDFLFRLADVDLLFTRKKKLRQSFKIKEELALEINQMYDRFLRDMDAVGPQLFEEHEYDYIAKLLRELNIQQELVVRKNQILNHLLARLGEYFPDDIYFSLNYLNIQTGRQVSEQEMYETLIAQKVDILDDYFFMCSKKSKSYDYTENYDYKIEVERDFEKQIINNIEPLKLRISRYFNLDINNDVQKSAIKRFEDYIKANSIQNVSYDLALRKGHLSNKYRIEKNKLQIEVEVGRRVHTIYEGEDVWDFKEYIDELPDFSATDNDKTILEALSGLKNEEEKKSLLKYLKLHRSRKQRTHLKVENNKLSHVEQQGIDWTAIYTGKDCKKVKENFIKYLKNLEEQSNGFELLESVLLDETLEHDIYAIVPTSNRALCNDIIKPRFEHIFREYTPAHLSVGYVYIHEGDWGLFVNHLQKLRKELQKRRANAKTQKISKDIKDLIVQAISIAM